MPQVVKSALVTRLRSLFAGRRRFGIATSVREACAEMRTFAPLQTLAQDLRHGARLLRRSPGWTLVAVSTLALGIGVNTAIFSLVRAVLLRPLPFPSADRLVVPCTVFTRQGTDTGSVAYADVMDWKAERGLFDVVAAYNLSTADITDGAEPERVSTLRADEEYFAAIGTRPVLGRFFSAEDNAPDGPRVVVVSHALWKRRFGQDPNLIGKSIELFGVPATIIGVAGPHAIWPGDAELVRPLGTAGPPDANMLRRDNHAYRALARLRRGVTIEQAQAKLTVMGTVVAGREANRAGTNWKLHALDAFIVGTSLRRALWVLLGGALLVLTIACVNVANLLVARGIVREHEIATRAALGAGRWRIAGQFLAESALLSAAGGLAGVFLGYWGLEALVLIAPQDTPGIDQAQVDARVLMFSAGLCVITTVLAGLAPAVHATRVTPVQAIRDSGRSRAGSLRGRRLRSLLVVGELALAVVLLTGAGLLVRSVNRIVNVDPGVVLENVLTVRTTLPPARYATDPAIVAGFDRVTEAIQRTPGVIRASATSSLPLAGGGLYLPRVFLREHQPEPPASADTQASWSVVQPGYFATMGIPIVEGRDFAAHDTARSTPVIVISRAMAKSMFPNGDPLGQRIRSWRDENLYREIVGVAGDVRYNGLAAGIPNNVYVPHTQRPWNALTFVVRTGTDPLTLLTAVRQAIWRIDRKLPLGSVQTMQHVRNVEMARPRLTMILFGLFGLAALALSAIGTYGIVAYAVSQRVREIGIRMALGAPRTLVMATIVWKALQLAAVALVCGCAAALASTRVLASLLFEVPATDPVVLGAASALLLGVVVGAASIPASRASRVDPVTTLRGD